MPIYEYQCTACGHVTEQLQKVSEAPLVICPECEKPDLQKIVSATSFQLKGTGWYATDFKTKPPAPATKATTTTGTDAPAATPAPETKTTATETKTDKS